MSNLHTAAGTSAFAVLALLAAGPGLSGSQVFTNSLGMRFVQVPAGSFYRTTRHWRTKKLIRWYRVELSRGFRMQTTEVTQGQWKRVMGKLPHQYSWWKKGRGDDKPVAFVSYRDVQQFIRKLNAMDPGGNYRLPTYAEWEYVAKGSDRTFFYWGNRMSTSHAVVSENSGKRPWKVGSKRPNRLGIYDLWGNMWEWTATSHDTRNRDFRRGMQGSESCRRMDPFFCFPAKHSVRDPQGVAGGALRRVAGYAYDMSERSCTSATMRAFDLGYSYYSIGFRLVRAGGGGSTPVVQPKRPTHNPALDRPMLTAAHAGKADQVRDLLARGANANARFKGWTALMYAAYYGHSSVVDELIRARANPRLKHQGWDAAAFARSQGHTAIQKKLDRYAGQSATRSRSLRPRPRPGRP